MVAPDSWRLEGKEQVIKQTRGKGREAHTDRGWRGHGANTRGEVGWHQKGSCPIEQSATNMTQCGLFSRKSQQPSRGGAGPALQRPRGSTGFMGQLTGMVLPSQHRKENPSLATLPRQRDGHPYLKGVALHQRDVLLIYQCVLGLEINVSKSYKLGSVQGISNRQKWLLHTERDQQVRGTGQSTPRSRETCQRWSFLTPDRTRGAGSGRHFPSAGD